MTDEEVYAALLRGGVPGTNWGYPLGMAPPTPFFSYRRDGEGSFFADDEIYYTGSVSYVAELYQEERDDSVLKAFDAAVRAIDPTASGTTAWLEDERCLATTYRFTVQGS